MPGATVQDPPDDDALVRRTQAGQRDAFGLLVERYQARVIALCAQITGDRDAAADLAQEAFVRAYTHLDSYQPGRSFFAWLYRIAVNGALNHRSRRPPIPLRGPAGELALLTAPDTAPSPEAQAEQAELARQVQAAIARLPVEYATVLALRYGADLDYVAIAATLDVPLGTVKARLHRAKALLRPLLEPILDEL